MTSQHFPLRAVLLTIATTTAVIAAVLLVQQSRGGWPFGGGSPATVPVVQGTTSGAVPDAHDRVVIDVSSETMQQLGIRIEPVREESLAQTVRAVATIVPDESRLSHIHTRVSGWVEQLDVSTTGEFVRVGQPLAHIFSQDLLSSQTEYLAARRYAASGIASAVVASGRTRLGVLGMAAEEISTIEQTGEPMRLVTVVAPRGGVVVHRGVSVGTAVDPSTELLTIADLSRVWVLAEVSEADIPAVRLGRTAQLEFPASGRPAFTARVDFIYPMLSERTRTLRVRLSAANQSGTLRPGSYGAAIFTAPGRRTLTVPRDALVDTGLQQHVFVAAGDRFEPRLVTVGARLADRVEILDGLAAGDQIVSAGVFLLDSESRLRATGGPEGHAHGGSAPAADQAPAEVAPHAGH
ncbi:MAG: efflux RND transporter periplasmic adaptor subunit [Vicinamibacterales bacterium]